MEAARCSERRPEDGETGLQSDVSLEVQGGEQDLPAGQSALLHCMEDTEDGPGVEQLLVEAVEAAVPTGIGKVEAEDIKVSPESSSGLAQKAEDGSDKGSAHPSASTRQRRVRRDQASCPGTCVGCLYVSSLGIPSIWAWRD